MNIEINRIEVEELENDRIVANPSQQKVNLSEPTVKFFWLKSSIKFCKDKRILQPTASNIPNKTSCAVIICKSVQKF
jgi:hypothetical protein